MTEPAEQEPPPKQRESAVAVAQRSMSTNLLVASVAGVLTLWLGDSMPNWPRNNSLALVYILMMPFLAIFPLAGLASLGWAGKALLGHVVPAGAALWFFFIAALTINLLAMPAFALGLRALLSV